MPKPNFDLLWACLSLVAAGILAAIVYFFGSRFAPLTLSIGMLSAFGLGLSAKTRTEKFLAAKIDQWKRELDDSISKEQETL
jgi:hypothetical protein